MSNITITSTPKVTISAVKILKDGTQVPIDMSNAHVEVVQLPTRSRVHRLIERIRAWRTAQS